MRRDRLVPVWVLWGLTAILLLAAALRLYDLSSVPPGLQHDEVFYAHDASTIWQSGLRLFYPENQGREPLFIYLLALSTQLIGPTALAIRLPAAFSGLLAVALTYRWGRALAAREPAVWASLFMAAGFWPVWLSRAGLRVATLVPAVALAGWLYVRALKTGGRPAVVSYVVAGLALGLSFYTYPAAYALAMALLVLSLPDLFRARLAEQVAYWGAAGIMGLPLWLAIQSSGGYQRAGNVTGPLSALVSGDPAPFVAGLKAVAGMWFVQGDPLWRYNVSGRPVFTLPEAVLFLLGIAWCGWAAFAPADRRTHGQHRAMAFVPVLCVLAGMLPGVLTDLPPSFLRTSPALPAAFILVGIGAVSALKHGTALLRTAGIEDAAIRQLSGTLALAVLLMAWVGNVRAYFVVWADNAEVQRVYRADLAAVAAYLRQHPGQGGVAISTTEPNNLDPFIFAYTPHGSRSIHWFDGLFAVVVPAGPEPGWLFVTREPVPPAAFQDGFYAKLPVITEQRFSNGELAYTLYQVPPAHDFVETLAQPGAPGMWLAAETAFPPDDPDGVRTALAAPVQLGSVARLLGYRSTGQVYPGQALPLTLYWEVTADVKGPELWAIFAHLLTPDGAYAAGRDLLAVPAATWHAGDVFIQIHDVLLPPDLPPGPYHLQVGLYRQTPDGPIRFPVMVDGRLAGDRILLEPVTVVAAP